MRHRSELPETLGEHFSVRAARDVGTLRGRLAARDLARPFHGVRSAYAPATFHERVASYVPRLGNHQSFGGITAARLWGLPIPWTWSPTEPLVVVSPTGRPAVRARGVHGRRLAANRLHVWHVGRAPVLDPVGTLFMCAERLTLEHTLVMADAVLSTSANYPGRLPGTPPTTADDLRRRLITWGRFRGCVNVREALELARPGVESPKETVTRLLLHDARLPEPTIQHEVFDGERFVARVDLAYPEKKVAIEYEGDGHRTGREQWRRDIQRQRALEDLGWTVIRLTQADLMAPAAFLARVRRALASH